MSPPASSTKGENGGIKRAKTDETTHTVTSDTNGGSNTVAGDNSSMKVQDFMSFLAKEANITNMTVETNDGRRISATFKDGLPAPLSTPANGADASATKEASSSGVTGKNGKTPMMSPTRDIAKTMTLMGAEKTASTPSTQPTSALAACTSPEWAANYENKHVSVTYSKVVAGQSSLLVNGSVQMANGSSSLPPKKRAKAEESAAEGSWNAMSALVDAATVAQREHEQVVPGAKGLGANIGASLMKKPTKRKPRKIIPEVKEYVEFTQKDVLFGRGGRSNHHPGNKIYREIVTNQQAHYRGCDKNEKTRVAQGIVDRIHNVVGGRFLELDREAKRWFLVPNVVARRKVGQALRENNTEEARAAKRAKYQGRLNSKKKNTGAVENGVSPTNGGTAPADDNGIRIQVGAAAEGPASTFKMEDVEGSKRVEV